jgi:protein tyrosine phosphatase (PTP) superfamily phosphohydrolase (DUF442 family)
MKVRNFLEISERIASSGQPARRKFRVIREAGYEVVINLALATSDNAIADELDVVTGLGMEYCHIPVVWEHPDPAQFSQFARAMQEYRGRRVWVHCALNMRVSAFLYLFNVLVEGWQEEDARTLLHRIWKPDATWQAFIAEVMKRYPKQL